MLEHLHQYVPASGGEKDTCSPIPCGGDQVTAARAVTAKKVRVASQGRKALRGLLIGMQRSLY